MCLCSKLNILVDFGEDRWHGLEMASVVEVQVGGGRHLEKLPVNDLSGKICVLCSELIIFINFGKDRSNSSAMASGCRPPSWYTHFRLNYQYEMCISR